MKRTLALTLLICVSVFVISNCHSSKKAAKNAVPAAKMSYASNIQPIIAASCSPCHIPANGGNKKPLDTYDAVKTNIDDAIRRIELNPTDKGFMPFRHSKLSADTIAVFKQWKDAEMPQ